MNKRSSALMLVSLYAVLSCATDAAAQATGYSGGIYSQNFNTLLSSGAVTRPSSSTATQIVNGQEWVNGATLPGWNITFENSSNVGTGTPSGTNGNWIGAGVIGSSINTIPDYNTRFIRIDDGNSALGSAYSYGSTNSSDRALGTFFAIPFTSPQRSSIALVLKNTSNRTFTEFTLKYRGETWRSNSPRSGSLREGLAFSYGVFAANAFSIVKARPTETVGWTNATNLNYLSPTNVGVYGATNGNQLFQNISGTVGNLNWTPGTDLALRWVDIQVNSSNDGLGIDDLTIEAVPEPATMVVLGSALFGLLASRKRR